MIWKQLELTSCNHGDYKPSSNAASFEWYAARKKNNSKDYKQVSRMPRGQGRRASALEYEEIKSQFCIAIKSRGKTRMMNTFSLLK